MGYWIVVVDDEALSLTNARSLLKEADMRVSCVRSGRELLAFMEKNTPDLVLLDVLMPEMDGFETYQRLRDMEEGAGRRPVPVIFLTGENDEETERRGLNAGASDFIHKPFNRDILLRRINNTVASIKMIENLTEEASIDSLTGFLNKVTGTARVEELCQTRTGLLMILDLDNFKLVNDLYGHEMGDRMLQSFANIVRRNIRKEDIVVRIGGDEFLAFFWNEPERESVTSLIARLNEKLVSELKKQIGEECSVPLGLSAGVVLVPDHGREYHKLFELADRELYKVKQNGKHGCSIYNPENDLRQADKEELEQELGDIIRIIEERSGGGGALLLGQDAFAYVYRFLMRYMKRYQMAAVNVLFCLETETLADEELEDRVMQFGSIVQKTLRKSDIVMRNKKNQLFLLLPALLEQHVPSVVKRVMEVWEQTPYHEGITVRYVVKSVDYREE